MNYKFLKTTFIVLFIVNCFLISSMTMVSENRLEIPSLSQNKIPSVLTLEDITWTPNTFSSSYNPISIIDGGEFGVEYLPELHIYETGSGTAHTRVGVNTTLTPVNGWLNMSFEGRAKGDHIEAVSLGTLFINPITMFPTNHTVHGTTGVYWPGVLDTGYVSYSCNIEFHETYEEIMLIFYYLDAHDAIWNQEIWIRNLEIYLGDDESPVIINSGNLSYLEGTVGNFIHWNLTDDNPNEYSIYRDDLLIDEDIWIDGESVNLNVDYLPIGTHNFTLIANDEYYNNASSTILVSVLTTEETKILFFIILVPLLVLLIFPRYKRKKS